jgi:hypothetical protein
VWDLRVGKQRSHDGGFEGTTSPVLVIPGAPGENARAKERKSKIAPPAKSVTSLTYSSPYCLVSSGSLDG